MPTLKIKLGGVDPSILRELSGSYKPFVFAFKELISNSYDADADLVEIRLADDFSSVEVSDDGRGMTPFEFHSDFTKVGGSYTRVREELTAKSRPKIGSKGIGFLAVARYCSGMEVVSTTKRSHKGKVLCHAKRKRIDLTTRLGVPLPRNIVLDRLTIESVSLVSERGRKELSKRQYVIDKGIINLKEQIPSSDWSYFEVEYKLDCQDLELHAFIDYDYLLSLENKADLEEIEDFCSLEIRVLPAGDPKVNEQYTKITLRGLKDFVVRDFKTPQKRGFVRNIESRPGIDQFLWTLRRCIPVRYELPAAVRRAFGEDNLESTAIKYIDRVVFSGPNCRNLELKRPVWGDELGADAVIHEDISAEVNLETEEIVARGYILGSTEIIYPAEYRGIAVRVRNVQIGAPSFFGVQNIATGAVKAALSQITGEINVLKGMDAIDALNPGRESFYEEKPHYKALRRYIVGEGEAVGGLLNKVISGILNRSQVASAALDQLSRADQRRNAMLTLSSAINYYSIESAKGDSLNKLFSETEVLPNGLRQLPDFETKPAKRVAGFAIGERKGLEEGVVTDFANKKVYFDPTQDRWSWQVFILGSHYEFVPKMGSEKDPICQLDTAEKKIYINWGHPLRQQMGDSAFLKSSLAWRIAYHASQGSVEDMMDLALKILSYTET